MVGEEGTRLTVVGGPGSLILWTGGGMGWVVPWVFERRGCPRSVRKLPGPTPSDACYRAPKVRPALSRLDAGRPGGTVPDTDRHPVTGCSPGGGATVRAPVLEPCPETFPGDAAAVAAGTRAHSRGAPGQAQGGVRVGEWGSTGRRSRRP